jgi:hypothetical protein
MIISASTQETTLPFLLRLSFTVYIASCHCVLSLNITRGCTAEFKHCMQLFFPKVKTLRFSILVP